MKLCEVWERGVDLIKCFWVEFLPFCTQVSTVGFWWNWWMKSKKCADSILAPLTKADCFIIMNKSKLSLAFFFFLPIRWLLHPEKLIKLQSFISYQYCNVPTKNLPENSWNHNSWGLMLFFFLFFGGLLTFIL